MTMTWAWEPIDRGSREALREDRAEAGRVEVRGQDQRALLVGGVDQAIERLGLVGAGGQQSDVVDDHELRADDPLDDRADLVAAGGQFSWPRAFRQLAARVQILMAALTAGRSLDICLR